MPFTMMYIEDPAEIAAIATEFISSMFWTDPARRLALQHSDPDVSRPAF